MARAARIGPRHVSYVVRTRRSGSPIARSAAGTGCEGSLPIRLAMAHGAYEGSYAAIGDDPRRFGVAQSPELAPRHLVHAGLDPAANRHSTWIRQMACEPTVA